LDSEALAAHAGPVAMTPRYFYVHLDADEEDVELASLALFELGASGVEERDRKTLNRADGGAGLTLVGSFGSETEAQAARAELAPRWPARLVAIDGDAWRDAWKAYFEPTRIGERLVVKPSFKPYAKVAGDVVLTLDPGGAFGTGTHETTRLLLEALQRHLAPGMHVLDVGCGSGILAIACLLLGAGRATGIDIDAESVRVSRENAELNFVQERLALHRGELSALPAERFPLVLANIESRVLVPLAGELCARLTDTGVLVLGGLLAPERARVLEAYRALELIAVHEQGEWIAIELRGRDG
jgi:ribosomal protein L11 methyltransferase